uniref:Uncharacterized protein n=1 Tax=Amphimedon queenslandica TaxID=400682 RepID=A0A1X7UVE4_AMPQE
MSYCNIYYGTQILNKSKVIFQEEFHSRNMSSLHCTVHLCTFYMYVCCGQKVPLVSISNPDSAEY